MVNLKDKIVIVTGGGSGIGRLMCIRFAAAQCTVITCDIRFNLIEETRDLIHASYPDAKVHLYQCDLSRKDSIYEFAARVQSEVGKVDILINNAGIVSGKSFLECDDATIERTMAVNTMAHIWLAKKFLPPMIESHNGKIVSIASAAATCGVPGLADYCASKWGAFGFNESIRTELKKQKITGVTTLCVCPYYINTGMFDGVTSKFPSILPILEPTYVVDQIMDAIQRDKEVLYMPGVISVTYLARALFPVWLSDWIADFIGITATMDSFKGRGSQWTMGTDVNKKHQ